MVSAGIVKIEPARSAQGTRRRFSPESTASQAGGRAAKGDQEGEEGREEGPEGLCRPWQED